ncbi:MAG: polymer-forming cytoskeletal protein [Candidatus Omnitrophica bacterium]|nr:polymer-forming cytoskeletal protein [Candidatus Omnitrophota bacterium]
MFRDISRTFGKEADMVGKRDKRQEAERVLDVDASMQGSLVFKDPVNLRINGRFEGTLDTKGSLMIGENASVDADISGDSIVIAGRVNGNIRASKELKLIAPAHVVGELSTPILSVAEGAVIDGMVRMVTKKDPEFPGSLRSTMTPEELSKYLEIEVNMILDWVNSGKLPGIRDGNAWRFERNKIDEWVAAGKIK